MKELCEKNSLSIGNLLPICEGKTTWQRGLQTSTIDYILINEEAKRLLTRIEIDESGIWSGGSDHNRIAITLSLGDKTDQMELQEEQNRPAKETWKLEEENLTLYGQEMERKIKKRKQESEKITYECFVKEIIETATESVEKKP